MQSMHLWGVLGSVNARYHGGCYGEALQCMQGVGEVQRLILGEGGLAIGHTQGLAATSEPDKQHHLGLRLIC